jgi:hypothetical protein
MHRRRLGGAPVRLLNFTVLDVPENAVPRSRVHVLVLVTLLVISGLWIASASVRATSLVYAAIAGVVLIAAAGAALSQPWARFLIYALAAAYSAQWLSAVLLGLFRGPLLDYLRSIPLLQGVLSFMPAAAIFFVIGYCCWVAHTYVGRRGEPI